MSAPENGSETRKGLQMERIRSKFEPKSGLLERNIIR